MIKVIKYLFLMKIIINKLHQEKKKTSKFNNLTGTDQLHHAYHAADQHHCFSYKCDIIPLLFNFKVSSQTILFDCTAWCVLDLV